jgi:hypothetical protein
MSPLKKVTLIKNHLKKNDRIKSDRIKKWPYKIRPYKNWPYKKYYWSQRGYCYIWLCTQYFLEVLSNKQYLIYSINESYSTVVAVNYKKLKIILAFCFHAMYIALSFCYLRKFCNAVNDTWQTLPCELDIAISLKKVLLLVNKKL